MDAHITNRINCLKQEKTELGSYNKLALKYGVNVRYVWDLLVNDNVPHSRKIRKKLGIVKQGLEYTRTRIDGLNKIARYFGHASWSAYETAILNTIDTSKME